MSTSTVSAMTKTWRPVGGVWRTFAVMVVWGCVLGFGCNDPGDEDEAGDLFAVGMEGGGSSANGAGSKTSSRGDWARSADEEDDPGAPAYLPASEEMPSWTKTEPVRVRPPDAMDEVIESADLRTALETFQLIQCATTEYESPGAKVQVLFFETAGPNDAFGVFSLLCRTGGHAPRPSDQGIREMEVGADRWRMLGWQGTTCLQLTFPGSVTNATMRSVAQLFNRIVFTVPPTPPPLAFSLLTPSQVASAKIRVMRSIKALKPVPGPLFVALVGTDLDDVLGLSGAEVLSIVEFGRPVSHEGAAGMEEAAVATRPVGTQPEDAQTLAEGGLGGGPLRPMERRHLVWFVEYPSAAMATAAYDRYEAVLASPRNDLDRQTRVTRPVGPFLPGTWTSRAESAAPVLLALREALANHVARTADTRPADAAAARTTGGP